MKWNSNVNNERKSRHTNTMKMTIPTTPTTPTPMKRTTKRWQQRKRIDGIKSKWKMVKKLVNQHKIAWHRNIERKHLHFGRKCVCVYGTRAFTYIVRKILMKSTVNVLADLYFDRFQYFIFAHASSVHLVSEATKRWIFYGIVKMYIWNSTNR